MDQSQLLAPGPRDRRRGGSRLVPAVPSPGGRCARRHRAESQFAVSTEGTKICPRCGMGNLWTERRRARPAEAPLQGLDHGQRAALGGTWDRGRRRHDRRRQQLADVLRADRVLARGPPASDRPSRSITMQNGHAVATVARRSRAPGASAPR